MDCRQQSQISGFDSASAGARQCFFEDREFKAQQSDFNKLFESVRLVEEKTKPQKIKQVSAVPSIMVSGSQKPKSNAKSSDELSNSDDEYRSCTGEKLVTNSVRKSRFGSRKPVI